MSDENVPDDLLPDGTHTIDPADFVGGLGTGLLAAGITLAAGPPLVKETLLLSGGFLFLATLVFNVVWREP